MDRNAAAISAQPVLDLRLLKSGNIGAADTVAQEAVRNVEWTIGSGTVRVWAQEQTGHWSFWEKEIGDDRRWFPLEACEELVLEAKKRLAESVDSVLLSDDVLVHA